MGPRLFSRGRVQPCHVTNNSCEKLQWGRGCSAAEGTDSGGLATVGRYASMGPRLFSRGRLRLPRSAMIAAAMASMGPRLFSRGRSRKFFFLRFHLESFNGAAAVQPRKEPNFCPSLRPFGRLQWGRGCSAAEGACFTRWRLRRHIDASMGPRLFSRGRGGFGGRGGVGRLASMGPRLFSRGRHFVPQLNVPNLKRFNGAAAVQPRKGGVASDDRPSR